MRCYVHVHMYRRTWPSFFESWFTNLQSCVTDSGDAISMTLCGTGPFHWNKSPVPSETVRSLYAPRRHSITSISPTWTCRCEGTTEDRSINTQKGVCYESSLLVCAAARSPSFTHAAIRSRHKTVYLSKHDSQCCPSIIEWLPRVQISMLFRFFNLCLPPYFVLCLRTVF